MAEASLITQINDWMIEQALGEPDILDLFDGVCQRFPASASRSPRARLMWSTLHPLFRAENGAVAARAAGGAGADRPHRTT